jgi:hypothetical protein
VNIYLLLREWVLILLTRRVSIYRLYQGSGTYESWLLSSMDVEGARYVRPWPDQDAYRAGLNYIVVILRLLAYVRAITPTLVPLFTTAFVLPYSKISLGRSQAGR